MRTFSQSESTRLLASLQVYKSTRYQVSASNTVVDATGFRSIPTSIRKYRCSISCHVPRCPIPSQHISHWMRSIQLPQNTFSQNRKAAPHPTVLCSQHPKLVLRFMCLAHSSRITALLSPTSLETSLKRGPLKAHGELRP